MIVSTASSVKARETALPVWVRSPILNKWAVVIVACGVMENHTYRYRLSDEAAPTRFPSEVESAMFLAAVGMKVMKVHLSTSSS